MMVDIGGVRQGVSELLQAVYIKPLGICCSFATVLKLNFVSQIWGNRDPYGGGLRSVRWSDSDFTQIALQSP